MRQEQVQGGTEYSHDDRDEPHTVKSNLLITTVRVVPTPGHDHVHIWNRGGKSGMLVVNTGDGELIASRLLDFGAYAAEVTAKLQFLVNFLNESGQLEHGMFTFPDGDSWAATP